MAGHEDTGSKPNAEPDPESVPPFGTPVPLHREPRVIEGQVLKTPGDPESNGDSAPAPDAFAAATEPEPVPAEAEAQAQTNLDYEAGLPPDMEPPGPPPASPPVTRQRFAPMLILIAALIGAVTGFISAYAARIFLDDTQQTIAAIDQRLTALSGTLAADEKKLDAASADARDTRAALDKRLGAAEKTARDALGLATAAQTAAANSSSGEAPAAATVPAPDVAPDLTPLQSRIDALDQRLTQLETAFNAPKTAARAPQEPEAKPNPQAANAPAIAIVADTLVQKIASGAPFTTELAALSTLGADKAKLAALQPAAAKGVVTTRRLSEDFNALTPALRASEPEAPDQDEGFFARLKAHAANLVSVRRIDDHSGPSLPARIARVQDALGHDDVEAALQEWAALPDTAKAASADWEQAAKTRVKTLAQAKDIASEAVANLARVKS
jgi:hypothetical protein